MDETLLEALIEGTGLPKQLVRTRLKAHIMEMGKSPASLSLEDLREVLVPLLQSLFIEVAEGNNQFIKLSR